MKKPHHLLLFLIRDTDGDEVEGREQQSTSNDSSEGNKVKSTEDVGDEALEIHNEDEKENEKSEDAEPKEEFGAKNRLRQRVTRNSAIC